MATFGVKLVNSIGEHQILALCITLFQIAPLWNAHSAMALFWSSMMLSIILGARGYSCKFSAPGHTITGPALTWSSHLCTVMPSPIVHWCPGQPGPRVTRNSKPGLNLWWMQSDELVSCDDQWGDSIRVPRPVRQVTIPVEVSQWKPW